MKGEDWKWWYFVVAGVLIGAYGIYEIYSKQISKSIGSEVLALLCIAIGLFSRKAETQKKSDSQAGTQPEQHEESEEIKQEGTGAAALCLRG